MMHFLWTKSFTKEEAFVAFIYFLTPVPSIVPVCYTGSAYSACDKLIINDNVRVLEPKLVLLSFFLFYPQYFLEFSVSEPTL